MPWFEIIYSEDPTSGPLSSDKVNARDRSEAAAAAMSGFVTETFEARNLARGLLRNQALAGPAR